jgi:hypothetical protein
MLSASEVIAAILQKPGVLEHMGCCAEAVICRKELPPWHLN